MESRGKSIVLVGMMGAGKSSVGRALQWRTGLDLFDTDKAVAEKFELTIPEIFERFGEEKFREAESEVLRNFSSAKPVIVVTGGGIVLRAENTQALKRMGMVVWLEADESILLERAMRRGNRPLLRTSNPRERMTTLMAQRKPLYQDVADLRVDSSSRTHEEVVDIILAKVESLTTAHE